MATTQMDSGIRVCVTPAQSSYFAGEPFEVTVTFTNTRSPSEPVTSPAPTRAVYSHKRAAHSISSAPLARPPTSPGTPKTATASFMKLGGNDGSGLPERKGYIGSRPGKSEENGEVHEMIAMRRSRQLSVDVRNSGTVRDEQVVLEDGEAVARPLSASYAQHVFSASQTPTSPRIPSGLSRSSTLPLPTDHPHARKQSVLDGQVQLHDLPSSSSAVVPVPPSPQAPFTPSSSTSTFSLSLDPISETGSTSVSTEVYPATPTLSSPSIDNVDKLVPAYPPTNRIAPIRRATNPVPSSNNIGLGHPANIANTRAAPKTAFSSTFPQPNTELLLYAYAQLSGSLTLLPHPPAIPGQHLNHHAIRSLRVNLRRKQVIGGGSMDIATASSSTSMSSLQPAPSSSSRRRTHSRSSSFTGLVSSLLSPSSQPPSSASGPTSTSSSTPNTSAGLGLGISPPPSSSSYYNDLDDAPLPTFTSPPTPLLVDLLLSPGESRTYTYTIELPKNLPPTFKGRAIRVEYELVVGVCRGGAPGPGTKGAGVGNTSRVMKVPVRLYNYVSIMSRPTPYDLLYPVSSSRHPQFALKSPPNSSVSISSMGTAPPDSASSAQGKVVEHPPNFKIPASLGLERRVSGSAANHKEGNEEKELKDYARRLVATLPDPKPSPSPPDGEAVSETSQNGSVTNGSSSSSDLPKLKTAASSTSYKELQWEEEERRRRLYLSERNGEEGDRDGSGGTGGMRGCREAVEVLSRVMKKASYEVNKDSVRVANLVFTKESYRLGESVTGCVEVNERSGMGRVVKMSILLESHESIPTSLLSSSSGYGANKRQMTTLRRTHASHTTSFALSALRIPFALDIPSDASPCFEVDVAADSLADGNNYPPTPGSGRTHTPRSASVSSFSQPNVQSSSGAPRQVGKPGGLEWKVRLCLLVAVASETCSEGTEGVRFKSVERDGERGEWGGSWRASDGLAPSVCETEPSALSAGVDERKAKGWGDWFKGLAYGDGDGAERRYHDGDALASDDDEDADAVSYIDDDVQHQQQQTSGENEYDGIKPDPLGGVGVPVDFGGDAVPSRMRRGVTGRRKARWKQCKVENVECEVPVRVWPGNTMFRAGEVVFDV